MSSRKRPHTTFKVETVTSPEASQSRTPSGNLVWKSWCRLCAKEDPINNVKVFCKSEKGGVIDTSLATAIGKYFWVNITLNDQLPTFVCTECHTLVTSLCAFAERVNKVQSMYNLLRNVNYKDAIYPYEVRGNHGLADEDWEHIIKLQRIEVIEHVRIKQADESADVDENVNATASLPESDMLEYNELEDSQGEEYSFEFADDGETEIQVSKKKRLDTATEEDFELGSDAEPDAHDQQRLERELSELDGPCTEDDIDDDEDEIASKCKDEVHYDENENDDNEYEEDEDGKHSAQVNEIDSSSRVCKREGASSRTLSHHRYECSICGKKYKNPTPYRKHMTDAHHASPDIPDFKCDKCNKILPTEHQLMMHSRTHLALEEKLDIPCPYCERKFTKVAVMKQHIRGIHENMKPYICDTCGRELKTLAALTEHKLVHTNDTPFQCNVCQKGFKNKARLKVHQETHTETVYVCSECGLKLNTRRTLKMHMLVHSDNKRYKCDFCGSAFKRAKALKNHLILHTGLRPYKCNFCEKTFSNGSNCRSHKKKVHPVELASEMASGKKTEVVTVPKLEELRSSTNIIENPRKVQRHVGGLSLQMRKMLIAAEERAKRAEAENKKRLAQLDAEEASGGAPAPHFIISNAMHVETDEVIEDVEVDEVEEEDEEEDETVIYEIIDEI